MSKLRQRAKFGRDPLPAVTQHCLSLFARNAFESFQEVIERESVSEVIEQCFYWQAGSAKDWSASENPRVRYDQTASRSSDLCHGAHN